MAGAGNTVPASELKYSSDEIKKYQFRNVVE